VDARAERLGRNEILFRDVNEAVLSVDVRFGGDGDRWIGFYCECAAAECARQIDLTLAEYESVRADPTCFACAPGHVVPDLEDVVHELGGRAVVVRKREGGPAELARDNDPR
jgi:hypothetical protein